MGDWVQNGEFGENSFNRYTMSDDDEAPVAASMHLDDSPVPEAGRSGLFESAFLKPLGRRRCAPDMPVREWKSRSAQTTTCVQSG